MRQERGVSLRRGSSLRVRHRVGEDILDEVNDTVPARHKWQISIRDVRVRKGGLEAAHAIGMSARMILDIELPDLT